MDISTPNIAKLSAFDRYFLDAVLRLRAVSSPSPAQLREALAALNGYYAALMKAPESDDPRDVDWLRGRTLESAAARFAFLFTQFDVPFVSRATAEQLEAFSAWWLEGGRPQQQRTASAA